MSSLLLPPNFPPPRFGETFDAAAFSVLDLSPSLWWRSDNVTITGSGVSVFTDQSGNGVHGTQSTDSRRPTYATNQINGRPALGWSDAAQTQLLLSLSRPTNGTVIAVVKLTNAKTGYRSMLTGAGTPDMYANCGNDGVTTPERPSIYWSGQNRINGASNIANGVWRAMRWGWDASNLYIAYNDGAAQSVSRGALTTSGSWTQFGTGGDTFNRFDGQLAELIVMPTSITAGQIVSLNNYLKGLYALWT